MQILITSPDVINNNRTVSIFACHGHSGISFGLIYIASAQSRPAGSVPGLVWPSALLQACATAVDLPAIPGPDDSLEMLLTVWKPIETRGLIARLTEIQSNEARWSAVNEGLNFVVGQFSEPGSVCRNSGFICSLCSCNF